MLPRNYTRSSALRRERISRYPSPITNTAPAAAAQICACSVAIAGSHLPTGGYRIPFVTTPNPRRALALAAAKFFPLQPSTIAAVTGTSGKTSVAAFTRQIWQRLGFEAASIGTIGLVSEKRTVYGSLTTPDPIALHRQLALFLRRQRQRTRGARRADVLDAAAVDGHDAIARLEACTTGR